jgi:DNA-binding CsgD family transcriptional regulator/esterase/lipase
MQQRMADLEAVISSAGCRRPFLLGYSDGGHIAIRWAAAHPRRVRGLILYGCSPRNPPEWAMKQLRAVVRNWGRGALLEFVAPTLAGGLARPDIAAFERASASPGMIKALVESLATSDVRGSLGEIAVPTLVVHRRDDLIPLSHAKVAAKAIRGARLVELEGSDHLPWLGDADSVLSAIARFVREVSPDSTPRTAPARRPRARDAVVGWAALTDAERRVADLVCQGLKNREVAERLFISPYTVETHLKHAYTKLGIGSRGQLVALAARNT